MTLNEDRIREIAEEILSEGGQAIVEEHLIADRPDQAMIVLLGGIDRRWEDGKLSDDEARALLTEINIPKEQASKMRQAHALK